MIGVLFSLHVYSGLMRDWAFESWRVWLHGGVVLSFDVSVGCLVIETNCEIAMWCGGLQLSFQLLCEVVSTQCGAHKSQLLALVHERFNTRSTHTRTLHNPHRRER